MPFLIPVLEFFAPLFKKLDTWLLLVILLLALAFNHARHRADTAEAALAARPKVETKIEQKVKTVRVAGPVRVEEKIVYKPGTTEVQYVDRIIDRAPVTTTTDKESQVDKKVEPACAPAAAERNRFVGVSTSPLDPKKAIGIKAGMTVFRMLDVSTGYSFYGDGRDRIRLEAAYRF